ncbi:hypothetical protein [Pseudorhodoplanes sp.]|uniref:hypothetical protein n=1 Tax=Pseudorhodoplanes sp. TaxID=1934341 RepID=UPI00391B048D
MTREEFIRLSESWGGDVSRWPPQFQETAADYALTGGGERILERARRLDRVISLAPPVDPARSEAVSSTVMQRIAFESRPAGAPRSVGLRTSLYRPLAWLRASSRPRPFSRPWALPAVSLAGSLLLGLSLGAFVPPSGIADPPRTSLDLILDTGFAPLWGFQ